MNKPLYCSSDQLVAFQEDEKNGRLLSSGVSIRASDFGLTLLVRLLFLSSIGIRIFAFPRHFWRAR
jgi:hypothetical protein